MSDKSDITVVLGSSPSLKGATLYVEEPPAPPAKGKPAAGAHRADPTGLITPTAVYIPASYDTKAGELNVILWMHGHYVKDYQTQIFGVDNAGDSNKLRESVDAAGKNVVLVVPYLGFRDLGDGKDYVVPKFAGGSVEDYLVNLLDVLMAKGHLGKKTIDRLVVACHSGSGHIMIKATRDLGKLRSTLKECWGYDCMYTDFTAWMVEFCNVPIYYYHGTGSKDWRFHEHWKFAYGVPGAPRKPRLDQVRMAPGTKNPPADMKALTDQEVFQSFEQIQLKKSGGNKLTAYEAFRLNDLDPLLAKDPGGWQSKVFQSVKGHYEVVRDLVAQRIVGLFQPAPVGLHTIADCKAP